MNISAISSVNCTAKTNAFSGKPKHEPKPLYNNTDDNCDDYLVCYSDWGGMVIPVTASQIRKSNAEARAELKAAAAKREYSKKGEESPEEYYRRKINSTEWGAY